jgi:hypothetical protein
MSKLNDYPQNEDEERLYYRIGTTYYRNISIPMADGTELERLCQWSAEAIKLDHGKDALNNTKIVKKLDSFVLIPSHLEYQRVIKNKYYNKYAPMPFVPYDNGMPIHSLDFVKHIFGDQFEIGLDYLKILLEKPIQQLPILCLISKERATGKSTFVNWLRMIFGSNMTLIVNDNFGSQFNADWATKLIIAMEETLLNKKEDSERFKNLSTAKYSKVESKGVDRQETEFFGKFILCSNNEDNFIYLDKDEIRFWVRKIGIPTNVDSDILQKLTNEIPSFLYFLRQRPMFVTKQTRMWFTPAQLKTTALERLKRANQNKLEFELAQILITIIDNLVDNKTEAEFCLGDALIYVKTVGFRSPDSNALKRILQDNWGLKPENNTKSYTKWLISNNTLSHTKARGRYYSINKKMLENLGFLDA